MVNWVSFFVYMLSSGLTISVTLLSLLYWLRRRVPGRLYTLSFIAYLGIILFFAGVRFYWGELIGDYLGLKVTTVLAEFVGFGFLLYYIPVTMNRIVGRKWTILRLTASVTAFVVYVLLGTAYMFTGFLELMAIISAMIYFVALCVILIDILRNIAAIRRFSSRITIILMTIFTVTFLPLIMISRLLEGIDDGPWTVSPSIRFLIICIYYFWMAITGIVFYLREMGVSMDERIIKNTDDLPLTKREVGIAQHLCKGQQYNEIAEKLGISTNTVRNHVANIYKKLAVRSKLELIGVLRDESRA